MGWMVAAVVVVLLLVRYFTHPVHKALALAYSAGHAQRRGNLPLAEKFFQRSLESAGKLKEPRKSRIEAQVEIMRALLRYRQGRMQEAAELFRTGIPKATVTLPREYETVQRGLIAWGDLCGDEGRHWEAELHYRKAYEKDERCGNAAGMTFAMQRLADSLMRQDKRAQAEEAIDRAIVLETQITTEQMVRQGRNPADYRVISMSLPDLHFCREQYVEAAALYREKVAFWEKQVARPDNVDVGRLQMRLALCEEKLGHPAEAIEMYTRAEGTYRREWCEEHPKTVAAREARTALVGRPILAAAGFQPADL
jgi:tetratricopeptide (TPR) repeat protein